MRTTKIYWIILSIIVILLPLGIILPSLCKSGPAWGEWSAKEVKEQTGKEPAGMKKHAAVYQAPVAGYSLGKQNETLEMRSVHYIISGLLGTGIILLLTFGAIKIMSKKAE